MTSAQTMLTRPAPHRHRGTRGALVVLLAPLLLIAGACARGPAPVSITRLIDAPYDRGVVVAVAPLVNESGTSLVDELEVSDALVNTLGQVRGVSTLPINRTLGAMRANGIASVPDEKTALLLARELGADAIVVGTVTAWDPYNPPVIGLNLAMYGHSAAMRAGPMLGAEPRDLQMSPTDQYPSDVWGAGAGPLSTASSMLDASSNAVQLRVRDYAATQGNTRSAVGWRRHMASMDLYTKFACHELVNRLFASEHQRLTGRAARAEVDSRR